MSKDLNEAKERIRQRIAEEMQKHHSALIGITDPKLATIATYQEFGWVQRVTAKQHGWLGAHAGWNIAPQPGASLVLKPRPFFHSTVMAKHKKWFQIARRAPLVMGIPDTEKLLALVGAEMVADVQQTIKDGGNEYAAFEERHPLTMAIYAQRAQGHQTDGTGGISIGKPLFLTGRMFASIHFEIIEEEPA